MNARRLSLIWMGCSSIPNGFPVAPCTLLPMSWAYPWRKMPSWSSLVGAWAELLAWCAESGRPCAVATSTHTTKAEYKLAAANLRGFFRVVIGGDQVVQGKPAPDIYLRAAAALGVPATECGVFEDSEPGVRAAHAAGARVVWVPDLALVDAATQGLAAAQVDSLRVVAQFLRANQKC